MKKEPKIMVFRLKELIYISLFIVFGIILFFFIIKMFSSDTQGNSASSGELMSDATPTSEVVAEVSYIPGVYSSSLVLNNCSLEVMVCVDKNHINSISVKNLDESISAMYPLIEGSINDISNQIVNSQSLSDIKYTEDCRYTYMILLDAIQSAINKATPAQDV